MREEKRGERRGERGEGRRGKERRRGDEHRMTIRVWSLML